MKIVIDIDEDLYNYMQTEGYDEHLDKRFDYQIRFAVKNGTPLPEGHGRLKDVDWIDDNYEHHYSDRDGSWCYAWKDIDDAPTIVEGSEINVQ